MEEPTGVVSAFKLWNLSTAAAVRQLGKLTNIRNCLGYILRHHGIKTNDKRQQSMCPFWGLRCVLGPDVCRLTFADEEAVLSTGS